MERKKTRQFSKSGQIFNIFLRCSFPNLNTDFDFKSWLFQLGWNRLLLLPLVRAAMSDRTDLKRTFHVLSNSSLAKKTPPKKKKNLELYSHLSSPTAPWAFSCYTFLHKPPSHTPFSKLDRLIRKSSFVSNHLHDAASLCQDILIDYCCLRSCFHVWICLGACVFFQK